MDIMMVLNNHLIQIKNLTCLISQNNLVLNNLSQTDKDLLSGVISSYNDISIKEYNKLSALYTNKINEINSNSTNNNNYYYNRYKPQIISENQTLSTWVETYYMTNEQIRNTLINTASNAQNRLIDFLKIYHFKNNFRDISFNFNDLIIKYVLDPFIQISYNYFLHNTFPVPTPDSNLPGSYSTNSDTIEWQKGDWLSSILQKPQQVIDYTSSIVELTEKALTVYNEIDIQYTENNSYYLLIKPIINDESIKIPLNKNIIVNNTIYTDNLLYNRYKNILNERNEIISSNYNQLQKRFLIANHIHSSVFKDDRTLMDKYNKNIDNIYYNETSESFYMLSTDLAALADDYQYQLNDSWPWCKKIIDKWYKYRKNDFPSAEYTMPNEDKKNVYYQKFYLYYSFADFDFVEKK